MLTSGDVVYLDLGVPSGREAGFRHPAVVVTAPGVLDESPNVVQVGPLTGEVGPGMELHNLVWWICTATMSNGAA